MTEATLPQSMTDTTNPGKVIRIVVQAALFAIPIVVALAYDIHRFYLMTVDADPVFVYEALRLNDGLPQYYLDHTGYVLFMFLAWWFQLLGFIEIISVSALSEIPAAGSSAFVPVFESLVFAGRYFAAFLSSTIVLIFFWGLRKEIRHFSIAALFALVLASSQSLGIHALMIHTEPLSVFFVLLGFFLLTRADGSSRPQLALALSAMFFTLALMAKMHAIFLVLGMPVLAILFGPYDKRNGLPQILRPHVSANGLTATLVFGLVLGLPALHMVYTAIIYGIIFNLPATGVYQPVIAAYVAGSVLLYGYFHRVPWCNSVSSLIFVFAGIATGLYFHLIFNGMIASERLINFVEHMYQLANVQNKTGVSKAALPWLGMIEVALSSLSSSLVRVFSPLLFLDRPIVIISWIALIGGGWLIYKRRIVEAVRVLALLCFAVAVSSAFGLYKVELKHLIYIDLWVLLAAAFAVRGLWPEWRSVMKSAVVAVLLITVGLNVFLHYRVDIVRRESVSNICIQAQVRLQLLEPHFRNVYCR